MAERVLDLHRAYLEAPPPDEQPPPDAVGSELPGDDRRAVDQGALEIRE